MNEPERKKNTWKKNIKDQTATMHKQIYIHNICACGQHIKRVGRFVRWAENQTVLNREHDHLFSAEIDDDFDSWLL